MKTQRLLVALTVLNLGLLTLQVVRPRLAFAQEPSPGAPWPRPGDRRRTRQGPGGS